MYVFLIGLLMMNFSLSGYESGATMAEEIKESEVTAPKSLIDTCIVSIVIGFVYIVGLLFVM